ncbi:MAG TPA: AgmX/PglI C-terminal domain-containing protein [Myxococcales bacterium]|nr:AgmX/PglI C-terminal domain-containing protein [Myxococcales bacterium]
MSVVGLGVALLVLGQAGGADKPPAAGDKPAKAAAEEEKPAPDVEKMPFNQDSVKQVIDYHLPKIQACYNEMLAGMDKAKEGMLKTSWQITAEGLVSKAKVERKGTTLKDPRLHECVVTVLSAMTFPKPADGKVHPIEYPFNLKANVKDIKGNR